MQIIAERHALVQVMSGEACVCASNERRGMRLCSNERREITFMLVTGGEACIVQVTDGEACVYLHNAATMRSIKLCGPVFFPVV